MIENYQSNNAMMPEAEDLCKKYNVPMIRGIKGSKNESTHFYANMGDGTMGIKLKYCTKWSKKNDVTNH